MVSAASDITAFALTHFRGTTSGGYDYVPYGSMEKVIEDRRLQNPVSAVAILGAYTPEPRNARREMENSRLIASHGLPAILRLVALLRD